MISCCKFAPLFASAPDQGSHCASNRLQNELGDPRHATSIYQLPSSYQSLCLLQSQLFLLYSQIVSNPSPSVSDSSLLVGSERDWAARITNWTDTLLIFLRHHLLESRKDSKGWIQLDKCRVAIAKFRWRNMFSMFGLWYLGERLFWSLLIEVGNQRVYGCSAVLWNSLMNPMRSYDISWDLMILWAWITRPKTWINEQRPRLACATRSQAPCLLCGVFFQNFGTNELEIVSRSSTLLWMDQWLSFSEVMFLYHIMIYIYNYIYNMIRLRIMCVSAVFPHVLSVK